MMRIATLEVRGPSVIFSDDNVVRIIVAGASRMLIDNRTGISLKADYFEGMITTDFKKGIMGSLGGTIFEADIESDLGLTSMRFILTRPLNDFEIENGIFSVINSQSNNFFEDRELPLQ